jgi:hypothetical protein
MDKLRQIFFFSLFGFSVILIRGQQIGNYVMNGSFEELYDCITQNMVTKAKGWMCVDSTKICATLYHSCAGFLPYTPVGYQNAKHGGSLVRLTMYYTPFPPPNNFSRSNIKNRLKQNLQAGKTYCVKMYVNVQNDCPLAIDGFGFYFGDNTIDTIIYNARLPLTFLTPQVSNPNGNIINDTMNWVPITGTFVANGNEKYLVINNFKSEIATNTAPSNTNVPGNTFSEYFIDAISCIEYNLPAYAGPDQSCIPGDSVFIGRQPDFATDSGCVWYKLPNMATPIATVSGLWVKPVVTTTFVVRQQLECSALKWDTVVISQGFVGLKQLKWYADNITLFPNPSSDKLNIHLPPSIPIVLEKITISNNLGQILTELYPEIKNNTFEIKTTDLSNGIYQIHLKTKEGTLTKQFSKIN